MNGNLKVSIVTVCYNAEKSIEGAIQSVLSQNYPDKEYIIVDGQSMDGTLEIINKYKTGVDRIISEKDRGIYDAMNKGVRFATGDVVYFLNADDRFVDHQVLADVAQEFLRHPSAEVLYGKVQSHNHPPGYPLDQKTYLSPIQNKIDLLIHGIGHQRIFSKRKVFEKTGPFDTRFKIYADLDWMLKAYRFGCTFHFVNRFVTRYNTQGASFIKRYPAIPEKIKISYENSQWWEFFIYFVYVAARKIIDLAKEQWYVLTHGDAKFSLNREAKDNDVNSS